MAPWTIDRHRTLSLALTVLLFGGLVGTGLRIAQQLPLENDEIYSQVGGIQSLTLLEILQGRILEGNNSPLFYLLQKTYLSFAPVHLSVADPLSRLYDPSAQILLRVLPVIYTSLSICLLFCYFTLRHGLFAGILALLLTLGTTIAWDYWAQARPYGLWLLLSTAHLLVLFDRSRPKTGHVALIHILLSLTAMGGTVQSILGTAVLMVRQGKICLKSVVLCALVPGLLGLFYWIHAPHYAFVLNNPALEMITPNISLARLLLMGILAGMLLCGWLRHQTIPAPSLWLILWTAIMLLITAACILAYHQGTGGPSFSLSSRYFLFLNPIGAVGVAMWWLNVWDMCRGNRWMRINLIQMLLAALLWEAGEIFIVVQRFGLC